jgi:exopolysaccharide biosynthesis polyprenyl glycosylphosphotransferase
MANIFGLNISKWHFVLICLDIISCFLSLYVGLHLVPYSATSPWNFILENKVMIFCIAICYYFILLMFNAYDYQQDFRKPFNVTRLTAAVWVGALVVAAIFSFPHGPFISRTLLVIQAGIFSLLLILERLIFCMAALPTKLKKRLLIIGAGASGQKMLDAINHRPACGLLVVGFVDDDPSKKGKEIIGLPVLGSSHELKKLVKEYQIDMVVVAITHEKSSQLISTVTHLSWSGVQVEDMPSLYEFFCHKVPVEHIPELWFLAHNANKKLYYRRLKGLIDFLMAAISLAYSFPFMLGIACAIKLDSPGPVFFRQRRLGFEGRPFEILKFRTMVEDAECFGPCFASKEDRRITRVGKLLRKSRLDELPQLFNILKGEMSFIGPRPEREVFIDVFQEPIPYYRPARRSSDKPETMVLCGYKERIPYYSYRLLVKPGLSGWAQIMYSYAGTIEATQEKLQYDLYYIKNMSFLLDLYITMMTVRIMLMGKGI